MQAAAGADTQEAMQPFRGPGMEGVRVAGFTTHQHAWTSFNMQPVCI